MTGDLGNLHSMPAGQSVYEIPDDHPNEKLRHSYWRVKPDGGRGKRLTGVTTISKVMNLDPSGLLRWAARTNGEGIAILASEAMGLTDADSMRDQLSWLNSADAIWRALEESSLTFEDIRDKAATRGTNVHELAFQALAEGKPVPDLAAMTEEEQGYAQAVMKFWLDREPVPTAVEQVLVDEERGVAGRMDFLGTTNEHLTPGVLDAKTGNYIMEADHVQVALYGHMAELCGFGVADWCELLHLRPDGSYELVPGQATVEDALACIDLYRRRGRIKGAATKQWKAAHQ